MIRLGYAQVKIAVKLLQAGIIMGMKNQSLRLIGDAIASPYGLSGINHVLIKDCTVRKPSQLLINVPPICSAYVGTKIGLDAKASQVLLPLYEGLLGIVKFSGNPL